VARRASRAVMFDTGIDLPKSPNLLRMREVYYLLAVFLPHEGLFSLKSRICEANLA
jgi:hypothetical protein